MCVVCTCVQGRCTLLCCGSPLGPPQSGMCLNGALEGLFERAERLSESVKNRLQQLEGSTVPAAPASPATGAVPPAPAPPATDAVLPAPAQPASSTAPAAQASPATGAAPASPATPATATAPPASAPPATGAVPPRLQLSLKALPSSLVEVLQACLQESTGEQSGGEQAAETARHNCSNCGRVLSCCPWLSCCPGSLPKRREPVVSRQAVWGVLLQLAGAGTRGNTLALRLHAGHTDHRGADNPVSPGWVEACLVWPGGSICRVQGHLQQWLIASEPLAVHMSFE